MVLYPCWHGQSQQACGYCQSLTSHRVLKDTKNSEKDTKNNGMKRDWVWFCTPVGMGRVSRLVAIVRVLLLIGSWKIQRTVRKIQRTMGWRGTGYGSVPLLAWAESADLWLSSESYFSLGPEMHKEHWERYKEKWERYKEQWDEEGLGMVLYPCWHGEGQ